MTNQDQVPEWAVEAAIHQLCVRTNVVYMPSMRLSDYSDSFQGTLLDAAAIIARHAPVIDVKKLAEALFDADNLWIRVWDVDAQRWLAGPFDADNLIWRLLSGEGWSSVMGEGRLYK